MRRAASFALCIAIVSACGSLGAAAQEPYYKGKRLTVLINFAAGGPTDLEGRLFAKYLARHIPGQPTVIVQNMDGAGGVIGAQYVGEVAPKDGTVLGYFAGTSWVYVSDPERWRVDFRAYEFVAYQPGTTVHFVRTDVAPGLKTPADIVKAQGLVAGGLSIDTSKDLRLRMGLDMLGVPFKYVTGYRSSAPARVALQRGEINMFSESPPSYRALVVPALVDNGQVIPVWWDDVQAEGEPSPQKQMEGLSVSSFPQLYRQLKGTKPSGPLWDAYKTIYDINSTLQRLIALPPGAPRPAYDALRQAIEALNNDKEFAAEAMKVIQFVPEYPTAPDMSQKIRSMLVASPEMRKFVNDYMKNVPKR
jgi:tripartite-type tricarboxylate transporter receptor subunit TctC